ncbi:hypothetical protein NPX13_g11159 [Xylaria arbuscula]|uniref:Uncharacterized protein n=1 Tax=Xylaria arbuscula TaxID=114810 RepID=A0A9W8N3B0_9PEZI|nr:hypothetical protein NPX13_g11159 [Xylaria arbuscula]
MQKNPTNPAEVVELARQLVCQDLGSILETECWEVLQFSLESSKFWPNEGITISEDLSVTNAIRFLDDIISSKTISGWKRRIAYVRLAELFVRLEEPVKLDRKFRRLEAKPGSKVAGSTYAVFKRFWNDMTKIK